jgi:hypothetical protein
MAYDGMPTYDDSRPSPDAVIPATFGPFCEDSERQGYCGHDSCQTIDDEWVNRYPSTDHDCAYDVFLSDPITVAYGAQGMIDLVSCTICDREMSE